MNEVGQFQTNAMSVIGIFQPTSVYNQTKVSLVGQVYCTSSIRESLTIC